MLSTYTDENGNVLAVDDEGDLGVCKHQGKRDEAAKTVQMRYGEGNSNLTKTHLCKQNQHTL